jgi:hypothetical protein
MYPLKNLILIFVFSRELFDRHIHAHLRRHSSLSDFCREQFKICPNENLNCVQSVVIVCLVTWVAGPDLCELDFEGILWK